MKKYIEDHGIVIEQTELEAQPSTISATKTRTTRLQVQDEEEKHSPKGRRSDRNGNTKDAMIEEKDEMVEEQASEPKKTSRGRVTRSSGTH